MPHQKPRIHDVMAVHGIGEQRRGDTLARFAERFYKAVRCMVQEAEGDPNEVELFGRYQQNRIQVRYQNEIFRLWEISWEHSFQAPSAGAVLDWLGLWSSQYFNRAYRQMRSKESEQLGHGPWPRVLWLLITLLDLTLITPLAVALFWLWSARSLVHYEKTKGDQLEENNRAMIRYHFAASLGLVLLTPPVIGLHILSRLCRMGAGLPLVGRMLHQIALAIESMVVGMMGDILLYIFDPVQASFIRGDLEQAIQEAHDLAEQDGREPLIHVIGHSMGSVIAYEVVSRSLRKGLLPGIKSLCTMGTVLDMVRYILDGEGLVQAEQVRFGKGIPEEKIDIQELDPAEMVSFEISGAQEEQNDDSRLPWLNLFARNDPATGFVRLQEFGEDATNRPVPSTLKNHSTYWTDTRYVYQPYLALITQGHPVFGKETSLPPLKGQTSIVKDVTKILGWLLALAALLVGGIALANWRFDTNWLTDWQKLLTGLPGCYAQWLLWLLFALLVWIVLALPTIFRLIKRQIEYRRRVPLGKGAYMNYWCSTLDKVGAIYTVALRKKGIWTVYDFLVAAVRPGGVQRLAGALHVPEEWIMERARQANLMRLGGVGPTQASWLMAAGIRSLAQLAQQDGGELASKITQAQRETVVGWIKKAQEVRDVI